MLRYKKIVVSLLVVFLLIGIGVYAYNSLYQNRTVSGPVVEVSDDQPEQVPGSDITFEDVPDYKVVKTNTDSTDVFEFFYKDHSLGKVELGKGWYVDTFLSFENGDEFFGFSFDDPDTQSSNYGGPSILYLANGKTGAFEKWSSFPSTKFFVTDISDDENYMVYVNPTLSKSVFLENTETGQVREFPVGANFSDFGDAVLSEDSTKIAFAATKVSQQPDSPITDFVESSINVIDVTTGQISTYQINHEPGTYSLDGWDGNKVEYEYDSDAEENE